MVGERAGMRISIAIKRLVSIVAAARFGERRRQRAAYRRISV
jgi:hypothetical protein